MLTKLKSMHTFDLPSQKGMMLIILYLMLYLFTGLLPSYFKNYIENISSNPPETQKNDLHSRGSFLIKLERTSTLPYTWRHFRIVSP